MKRISTLLLLLVVAASLAACKPTPTPTAVVPPTLPPTETPVPPTNTPLPPTDTPTSVPTLPPSFAGSQVLMADNLAGAQLLGQVDLPFASRLYWASDSLRIGVSLENSYRQYDALQLSLLSELPHRVLDVSADGNRAAVSPDVQALEIWDLGTQSVLLSQDLAFPFGWASFSPDGSRVMLSSMEEWAGVIYSTADGSLQGQVTGFETAAPVYNVSFGPDGTQAIWIARATLQISDLSSGTLGPQFNHMDFIGSWALAPQRDLLVTTTFGEVAGEFQPVIYLWNTVTGENSLQLTPGAIIHGLALDPMGELLAAGARPEVGTVEVRMYNLALAAAPLTAFPLPGAETVTDIAFAPDGKTLAVLAATPSGTVLSLWGIP